MLTKDMIEIFIFLYFSSRDIFGRLNLAILFTVIVIVIAHTHTCTRKHGT